MLYMLSLLCYVLNVWTLNYERHSAMCMPPNLFFHAACLKKKSFLHLIKKAFVCFIHTNVCGKRVTWNRNWAVNGKMWRVRQLGEKGLLEPFFREADKVRQKVSLSYRIFIFEKTFDNMMSHLFMYQHCQDIWKLFQKNKHYLFWLKYASKNCSYCLIW